MAIGGTESRLLTERFLDAPWLLLLVIFFVCIINLIIVSVRKANQINSLSLSLLNLFYSLAKLNEKHNNK